MSFSVTIKLMRHPDYYVSTLSKTATLLKRKILVKHNCVLKIYNLIVPMLLVSFTGIASVFIPMKTDSKLEVPITVVLTFIFLQTNVASMCPKTPTSPIVSTVLSDDHTFYRQLCPFQKF